jgi:hypothetical protein
MTRTGALVILLVVAALFGAPSRAFALQNSLVNAQVAPRSGTATTVFTFTVTYDGKFAATSVRTEVAGLSLPMTRVSGTSTRGTWSTASVLPSGSWQVTFRATSTQGNAPTIGAGSVTVAGSAATPPPSSGGGPSPEIIPGPGSTPPPSYEPAPVATPTPSASSGGTVASVPPGATSPPPTGAVVASPGTAPGASPGSGPGSGGGTAGAPAGSSPSPSAGTVSVGTGSAGAPGRVHGDRGPSSIGRDGSDLSGLGGAASDGPLSVLMIGLGGVAAVAIIGSAFLLATRRRASRATSRAAGDGTPTAASDATDAALERRTLRRARMRLDDDPIVAAMGLGTNEPRTPRRRAGQTASGPGERPAKRS